MPPVRLLFFACLFLTTILPAQEFILGNDTIHYGADISATRKLLATHKEIKVGGETIEDVSVFKIRELWFTGGSYQGIALDTTWLVFYSDVLDHVNLRVRIAPDSALIIYDQVALQLEKKLGKRSFAHEPQKFRSVFYSDSLGTRYNPLDIYYFSRGWNTGNELILFLTAGRMLGMHFADMPSPMQAVEED